MTDKQSVVLLCCKIDKRKNTSYLSNNCKYDVFYNYVKILNLMTLLLWALFVIYSVIFNYCNRESTPWVDWLACASIDCPAWARMLFLLYSTISSAISVSRIRDSAVVVFSTMLSKLSIVCSNLFCTAPRADLWEETFAIASEIASTA